MLIMHLSSSTISETHLSTNKSRNLANMKAKCRQEEHDQSHLSLATIVLLASLTYLSLVVQLSHQDQSVQISISNFKANKTSSYEDFKKSKYFVPLFDPAIQTIPEAQRAFLESMIAEDMDLYRTIAKEAIAKRNTFAPSIGLMLKYSTKLLSKMIRHRQEEQRINPRVEPKPAFFTMVADLIDKVIDRSKEMKKDKGYTKNSIDTEELYRQFDALMSYVKTTIDISPVGCFLKWDEMLVYRNDLSNPSHDKSLIKEAADITAQFRALGYDKFIFMAKRIVSLLRMFSRGITPLKPDDV